MGSLDVSQLKPWIITGHDGGYINIFDYETRKSIGSDAGDGNAVSIIKFIERKQWFIVGSFSGYINVYTYQQTKVQKITSFRAKGRLLPVIHSLAVHPTLPYVLSACNGHIQLWDWDKNWQCIRIFERSSFVANQYELAFNPNDTNEFASADTQEIKIWSLGSVKRNYTLRGHSELINSLNFFTTHDDNQLYLISGSRDNTAKIWDLQKRACVHTLEDFMSPVIFSSSYPSLPVLITCTKDGVINLWSSTDFRLMKTLSVGGPGGAYGLACLTGSGRLVMGNESTLFMVDIRDEEPFAS